MFSAIAEHPLLLTLFDTQRSMLYRSSSAIDILVANARNGGARTVIASQSWPCARDVVAEEAPFGA
jgi:hypothetical protein